MAFHAPRFGRASRLAEKVAAIIVVHDRIAHRELVVLVIGQIARRGLIADQGLIGRARTPPALASLNPRANVPNLHRAQLWPRVPMAERRVANPSACIRIARTVPRRAARGPSKEAAASHHGAHAENKLDKKT